MDTTVLVIDDSKTVREVTLSLLKDEGLFTFYHDAESGKQGFEILKEHSVDVVLCDLQMPGMTGFEFLHILRSDDQYADLPVIMLTGNENQKDKICGLELGASDYVTKPFDSGELIARVKIQLKIKLLQDRLKELANTDPLTRLSNRRHLFDTLNNELERSQRSGNPCSLAMLDVDHFKSVNDTYGHHLGDEVLVGIAGQLQECMRIYDLAARFGGEEFVLLMPGTDQIQAVLIAERIRQAVEAMVFDGELKPLKLTITAGVATFPTREVKSVDDLIRVADHALYRGKEAGRNRVESSEEQR
jgi:diguanylate cyclase (GGDEF)-like protein